jgi:hypothetical protein
MSCVRFWVLAIFSQIFGIVCSGVTPQAFAQVPNSTASGADWKLWQPDPSSVSSPATSFAETPLTIKNYDKYFYFYREGVRFSEALSDLRECDSRSRGIWSGRSNSEYKGSSGYGLAADLAVTLIFGPAQDRAVRRANMRRCMFYKGYERYGLPKEQWEAFNLQRIVNDTPERDVQISLARQALLASGPLPATQALGL